MFEKFQERFAVFAVNLFEQRPSNIRFDGGTVIIVNLVLDIFTGLATRRNAGKIGTQGLFIERSRWLRFDARILPADCKALRVPIGDPTVSSRDLLRL